MKRCAKCILPENYPGIKFSEEGVCNYCTTYKDKKYLGGKALKDRIDSFIENIENRNKSYDLVIGFSGGRDSSYLLHYIIKRLNYRPVAYFVDNGFIPKETKINIRSIADMLNVKLVVEENSYLKRCFRHHILSWMHRPSPATIGVLCTGCRLGIDLGIINFAKRNKIPVIIMGGTPFENQSYKTNIMRVDANSRGHSSFLLGYLSHIIRNPKWILNRTCLITQIREYYYHYHYHYYRKLTKKGEKYLLKISPFWSYIRWEENEVISTIVNELKWEKNPNSESTWRGDCDVALLKLYLYKKTLGFNDKDDGLSSLIRDGQISREEALERLGKEGEISEKVINEIFDKLRLDYSDLRLVLRRYEKINRS